MAHAHINKWELTQAKLWGYNVTNYELKYQNLWNNWKGYIAKPWFRTEEYNNLFNYYNIRPWKIVFVP